MKATNTVTELDIKDVQTKVIPMEVAPAVKANEVKKMFIEIDTKVKHFEKYSVDLVIETDETLTIAENNASELNDILKSIEKVRTIRKKPYLDAGKMIDEFAKVLRKPLEDVKVLINGTITNYKRVQEASARAEADTRHKEAEKLADEKTDEADRMARIRDQITARIYGGYWINKNNERKSSAGCIRATDCDLLTEIIKLKIPGPDSFSHYNEEYGKMILEVKDKLSEHKANLIQLESGSNALQDDAQEQINNAKTRAGVETVEEKSKQQAEIVQEAKKEIKDAEKDIKEAGKGVRKNLKFDVYDFDLIPKKYLALDEVAVREWANANKEAVRQKIKNGEVVIEGLNFYLEDSYVSR